MILFQTEVRGYACNILVWDSARYWLLRKTRRWDKES